MLKYEICYINEFLCIKCLFVSTSKRISYHFLEIFCMTSFSIAEFIHLFSSFTLTKICLFFFKIQLRFHHFCKVRSLCKDHHTRHMARADYASKKIKKNLWRERILIVCCFRTKTPNNCFENVEAEGFAVTLENFI